MTPEQAEASPADHIAGRHDDPKSNPSCEHCRELVWLHAEKAAAYTPQALALRATESPLAMAREFKQVRQERTREIVALLRQEADHPAAPPGRSLYLNEAADLLERTYGVRG